ncbi:MAG: hypothetical protein AYK22_00505 [Thermoplasmatales archaeon SG8-52-3]|nr:MAG: hypothetical protein AYK22_00505 [Thermoplasmatales archaeon SG8-52-3]
MKKKIIGIFVCLLLIVATVIPVAGNIKRESTTPIFAINTSVDKISSYNVYSVPLAISVTGPSDLSEVGLYYRWSRDNETWSGVQKYSIFEGFESGTQNTSLWNTYQTGGDARIQFDFTNAHSGAFSCAMDDFDSQQFDYSLNVIYTKFDFTDATGISIDFWEREWGDESNPAPDQWSGWGNYDVVAYTNDGDTWFEIVPESVLDNQVFTQIEYNISDDDNFESPADSNFAILFSQYDNVQLTNDGRAWDDITIEYSFGKPSVNWSLWNNPNNPDLFYPWYWDFNFPNGTGYYEFYSIGKKPGEPDEAPPLTADTICRYNRRPDIFNEKPANGTKNVDLKPELEISISDEDGETMNLTWISNSSGSWKAFASDLNVEDGTYYFTNNNFSEFDTTYWWYLKVTDGIYTVNSPIFHFTTEKNLPPYTPSNPTPEDGEVGVSIQEILTWSGGDPNQGDKVYYDVYLGTSSSPPLVAENILQNAYDPGTLEVDTTYYWQIVSEDSQGETTSGSIWSFTTEAEANYPPTSPKIYGSPNAPPGKELCWALISDDPDDHEVKYIIDWGDGNSVETDYYQDEMAIEECHTYTEEGEYIIVAISEDEKGLQSEQAKFVIKIQKPRSVFHPLLLRILERMPMLERLLKLIRAF